MLGGNYFEILLHICSGGNEIDVCNGRDKDKTCAYVKTSLYICSAATSARWGGWSSRSTRATHAHCSPTSSYCFWSLFSIFREFFSFKFALFVFCRCPSPWKSMEINASVHCLQVGVSNRPMWLLWHWSWVDMEKLWSISILSATVKQNTYK